MSRDAQGQVFGVGRRPESAASPARPFESRHRVLAVLDARTRGLPVSPEAAETAFVHDPVLGGFSPNRVLEALLKTGEPVEHQERRGLAASLQSAGWATSEAGLWLAAIDDELTGPHEHSGWWMSEEYEEQLRFETWPDGIVDVTLREELPSSVPARVERLVAAFRAIPADQEPWNLILDHGAGFERSALKVEHERREGITSHEANADWRRARRRLVERGECGILTPLLVALRDGPPEHVDRELRRLRRFCKRSGLPPLARKVRLQGK